jgi:uncharacterized membrane protein YdfJ with MMPL/SSD domain
MGLMGVALCLGAALAGCGGQPLVAPELMAQPRITETQLQAMGDEDLEQRRSAIAAQREQAGATFRQAEMQCWKRFAVTRCIDQAARTRRATLDQLRADDIVVQDEMRKRRLQRADERLQGKQRDANP